MNDTDHLNALELRLSHEREYLRAAKTGREKELRAVWIAQLEKEIAAEAVRLLGTTHEANAALSDDELLAELLA